MDNKWHTGCCVVFRVEKWVDKQVYLKPVSKLRLFYHVTCSNLRGQWKRASISASSVRRMSSGNSSQHDICTTASISEHTFMFFLCFSSTDTVRCVCVVCTVPRRKWVSLWACVVGMPMRPEIGLYWRGWCYPQSCSEAVQRRKLMSVLHVSCVCVLHL